MDRSNFDEEALLDIAKALAPVDAKLSALAYSIERAESVDLLDALRAEVSEVSQAVEAWVPKIAAAVGQPTEKLRMVFGPDRLTLCQSYLHWFWFGTPRPSDYIRVLARTGGFPPAG